MEVGEAPMGQQHPSGRQRGRPSQWAHKHDRVWGDEKMCKMYFGWFKATLALII